MVLVVPQSVQTNGTIKSVFVAAIANLDAPDISSEILAVSSLEVSCYITGSGYNAETTENEIEDDRLCTKQVYGAPGDSKETLEITYVFNPASPANNEAQLELTEGRNGFIVSRWAVDAEDDWAAGDIVDVIPVTLGKQRKNNPTRNTVHKITQKCFVRGEVHRDVELVA